MKDAVPFCIQSSLKIHLHREWSLVHTAAEWEAWDCREIYHRSHALYVWHSQSKTPNRMTVRMQV